MRCHHCGASAPNLYREDDSLACRRCGARLYRNALPPNTQPDAADYRKKTPSVLRRWADDLPEDSSL